MNTKSISSVNRTLAGKCLCGAIEVAIADEFLYAGTVRKGEDNVMHLCRICGSWGFSIVRDGEFAHVRMGILIDDPSIRPTFHIFFASKAPWDLICDGLPQFAELPDDTI